MAISKSMDFRGLTVENAYIRVDRIIGGKRAGFSAEAGCYASPTTTQPFDNIGFGFNYVEGEDTMTSAYKALKSLPQFSDAVDV